MPKNATISFKFDSETTHFSEKDMAKFKYKSFVCSRVIEVINS